MLENKISATLDPTVIDEIQTAISGISTKMPFMVDLTPDQKKELPKFGDKSVGFVNKAAELVNRTEDFLPRSFDTVEFKKDVQIYSDLYKILQPLKMLVEKLEDTSMLAGSEAYSSALVVYKFAKLSSGEIEGLESVLDDLGKRFVQKSSATED